MSVKPLPREVQRPAPGFALIEVLVTVLVLAIGLLGLAGLQTHSLRFTQTSVQHTQAILLANEMADRMRANPAGVAAGSYTGASTQDDCSANPCSPAALAGYDLAQWNAELGDAKRLTGGRGVVCLDSSPNDGTADDSACDGDGAFYAIKIWWNESDRRQSGSSYQRFSTSFSP
jgi:type IV pilus assembly protein PilV